MSVEDLKIGYGDNVLSTVSFELLQKQRMGIIGPNGIGKSTLIKTLVGQIEKISGEFKFGHQIDVGYFNQESAQMVSNKNVWMNYGMKIQMRHKRRFVIFWQAFFYAGRSF